MTTLEAVRDQLQWQADRHATNYESSMTRGNHGDQYELGRSTAFALAIQLLNQVGEVTP